MLPKRIEARNDLIPPGVMWPEEGSGYEANQYSPAGTIQREWWFNRALANRMPSRAWRLVFLLPVSVIAFGIVKLVIDILR